MKDQEDLKNLNEFKMVAQVGDVCKITNTVCDFGGANVSWLICGVYIVIQVKTMLLSDIGNGLLGNACN